MGVGLLAPAFLVGLAAVALPIVIHLRRRRTRESHPIPSLMFVRRVPHRTVHRRAIRHWLLLALRCAAVALLALAFARPFVGGAAVPASAAGSQEVVVALDGSFSMGYGGRWNRARAAARRALSDLGAGDRGTLIWFDDAATVAAGPTGDPRTLTASVDALRRPGFGTTRYAPALRLAGQLLADSSRPRRRLVLVTDFQGAGWQSDDLPALPEGVDVDPVDVATGTAENLTVAELALEPATGRSVDGGVVITARLARQGGSGPRELPSVLEVDGREVERVTVQLAPSASTTVAFDPVPVPAPVRAVVRFGEDALPGDNVFHAVLTPGSTYSVLVVEPPEVTPGDSLYLRRALEIGDRPAFRLQRRSAGELDGGELSEFALVVLNDSGVPPRLVGPLERWVGEGGGVLAALGEHGTPDRWRPASSMVPVGKEEVADRSAELGGTVAWLDRDHPVFEPFRSTGGTAFTGIRIYRYRTVRTRDGDRVLARFDDGSPALIESRVSGGRVLIWTSTLDGFWNDLPFHPAYLPLLRRLARYAVDHAEPDPWITAGTRASPGILRGRPGARDPGSTSRLRLRAPRGAPPPPEWHRRTSDRNPVAWSPGFYGAVDDAGETHPVAVNVDRLESDLSPIDPQELVAALTWSGRQAPAATTGNEPRRTSLWWYVLGAAVLLLAAEGLLANRPIPASP